MKGKGSRMKGRRDEMARCLFPLAPVPFPCFLILSILVDFFACRFGSLASSERVAGLAVEVAEALGLDEVVAGFADADEE